MRHIVHLLLGAAQIPLAEELKRHVLKYGEGDVKDYLHVACWVKNDGDSWNGSVVDEIPAGEDEFCSDLEQNFRVKRNASADIDSDAAAASFFSSLFTRFLTINRQGDSHQLHVCIHLPLFDDELIQQAERLMHVLDGLPQQYRADIMGYAPDLAPLFGEEASALSFEETRKRCGRLLDNRSRYSHPDLLHRFFLLQNCNNDGVSLNLDKDSLARIIGEFAMACVENYDTLFPQSEELEQTELTAFGLSVLSFDKYYFANYLLRNAYLKVLDRERVTDKSVDVNKASLIAQQCLRGRTQLFSRFYAEEIDPLVKSAKPHDEIAAEISDKLKRRIDQLIADLQSFISDKELSLPEKQAVIAQLLGLDDELLTGFQFSDDLLILEDCNQEPLHFFVDEVNQLLEEEWPDNDLYTYFGEHVPLPRDANGKIAIQLDEIKRLRQSIMRSTSYVREKTREMNEINHQMEQEAESSKRLTENGFIYGDTTFKLLTDDDVDDRPLEETYEPRNTARKDVDLRRFFTPIKNQGQVGACTVFSVASVFEYIQKKNKSEEYDLSERFVYHNVCKANGSMEDNGSSVNIVIESIRKLGICTEQLCPNIEYYQEEPSPLAYENARGRTIRQAMNVRVDHQSITSALSEGYPVIVSLKVFDSFGDDNRGFVYRPTDEELTSGKHGYHALVIVGYVESYGFYIVRNSWGTAFGDRGYCYIPFSYIEDTSLNRQSCIITQINDGVDAGGFDDTGLKVGFNSMDSYLRYAVIRNQVDGEKVELGKKNRTYAEKRLSYETLVQTFGKPAVRKSLLEMTEQRLLRRIDELDRRHREMMDQRSAELDGYKKKTLKTALKTGGAALILALLSILFLYESWLPNNWSLYFAGGFVITLLFLFLYISFRRANLHRLEEELNDSLDRLARQRAQTEQQLQLQHLKNHIAGMLTDAFSSLNNSMTNKYHILKSYVGNLSVWREEEGKALREMDPGSKAPFIMLLANEALDRYFMQNGGDIVCDTWLYEYLNAYTLRDETVISYKNRIKKDLADKLFAALDDFTIYKYISHLASYPYLDDTHSSPDELLPLLDSKSKPFLQYFVRDIMHMTPLARFIFIHTDSQEEKNGWRAIYPRYFQMTPSAAETSSRFKLTVIQKQDITLSDIGASR